MQNQDNVSRRNFLKKLGAGAIGMGALTISPASALNIKDSNGLKVYSNNTKYFDIPNGGPVQIQNTYLQLDKTKITNLAEPTNSQDAATKNYVDNNTGSTGEKALAYDFVL